jgi:peroxiredoxin
VVDRQPETTAVIGSALRGDDDGAAHLKPRTRLPAFSLPSTLGGIVDVSRLADAVIYIYPWTGRPGVSNPPGWDDIPGAHGSTPQAESFRDHHFRFGARGCAVFGLSSQPTAWQRELATRLDLPFALLSDEHFRFADELSLPRFETGGVTYLRRLTLIVRDGFIVETLYPVLEPAQNAAHALARVFPHDGLSPYFARAVSSAAMV